MNMQVEGKTLTKLEMINHLMENLGMTRQDSRAFVENFFSELSQMLTKVTKSSYRVLVTLRLRIKANVQVATQRLARWFMSQRAALLPLKRGKKCVAVLKINCSQSNQFH